MPQFGFQSTTKLSACLQYGLQLSESEFLIIIGTYMQHATSSFATPTDCTLIGRNTRIDGRRGPLLYTTYRYFLRRRRTCKRGISKCPGKSWKGLAGRSVQISLDELMTASAK